MNKQEITKKISVFKDIHSHFGGEIGLFIKNKKIQFFVENSKFGTPTEIKLSNYDYLYYFTEKIDMNISDLVNDIQVVLKEHSNIL